MGEESDSFFDDSSPPLREVFFDDLMLTGDSVFDGVELRQSEHL